MALRTRVCDLFGLQVPIVLAGMGGASHPPLAAAVSNAGGLGVLGAATRGGDELRAWIRETRRLTDRPFGVDTLLPASVRRTPAAGAGAASPAQKIPEYAAFARAFMEREGLERVAPRAAPGAGRTSIFSKEFFEEQMEIVIEEKVPVYAAGLGDPGPWMDRLHRNGTLVIAVVGAVRHARKVAASGVDAIVAQGHDAGGHNSPVGTLALIPQVVDAAGGIPVLGAGGIGDGRGVAAALMLGAEGAWVGTAFLATHEANIPEFQKEVLVESREDSTVVTRCVTGKPARFLRGKWTQAWEASGLEPLPMPFQSQVSAPVLQAAEAQRRKDVLPGIAGQGVGLIEKIRPAAEVLAELVRGAEEALARGAQLL